MKLIRVGEIGQEKPGLIWNNKNIDISAFCKDFDEDFFEHKKLNELSTWLDTNAENCPEFDQNARIGSCIKRPSKIVCIGLNYAKHAEESGMDIPKEPVVFFKSTSAICGPNDPTIIPKNSTKTDWEVELAVIIGTKASYIKKENAMSYVAGYCIHNDISERAFQLEGSGQWVKGKSNDNFAPIGPFLGTKDEIKDPQNLNLWLKLNGETLQNSNTNDMVFDIPFIISYLSNYMTLLPGDIISTGTPFGVGLGLNPPRYLKEGDIMELGIDGLGVQKQKAINYKKY